MNVEYFAQFFSLRSNVFSVVLQWAIFVNTVLTKLKELFLRPLFVSS